MNVTQSARLMKIINTIVGVFSVDNDPDEKALENVDLENQLSSP